MTAAQDPSETIRLVRRAVNGDEAGWSELQSQHRSRLRRLVACRLDQRMRARVDVSDVIQDALLEAWKKLPDYVAAPELPFYLWLRSITGNKLMALHRFHLGTRKREAGREVSIYGGQMPETTCDGLAVFLASEQTGASEAVVRGEQRDQLRQALDELDPIDREVLMLRHFEQLTNTEIATVLKIQPPAASKRYIRALRRLKQVIGPVHDSGGGG